MKDIKKMLENYWGTSYEKDLTEEEIAGMIKFDWENSMSIPDSKRYKMEFVLAKQEEYLSLGYKEEYKKWKQEENRLRENYPLIHGD